MILVVGGIASGKRTFAQSLGFADSDFSTEAAVGGPVLVDAQNLVRHGCEDSLEALADDIAAAKQVVLAVDVGSGIVPLDRQERAWRDDAGRLCALLAARASAVVRMVCGIPVAVKGTLPEGTECR